MPASLHRPICHAAGHAEAGEDEERATAEAVDGEEGDEARQELPGQAGTGEDTGELGAHSQAVLEQDGGVDTDEVAGDMLVVVLGEFEWQ